MNKKTKNKFITLITLSILSFHSIYSQFQLIDAGAKPISLGGAFTSPANNSSIVYY